MTYLVKVVDTILPVIWEISVSPEEPIGGEDVIIIANVTDSGSGVDRLHCNIGLMVENGMQLI